jgi:hypothetical protein
MPDNPRYSGRPKGATGQIPQYVKQTISDVLQARGHLIVSKLDQIKDPVKYLELMYKLTGFVLSKSPQPEPPTLTTYATEEERLMDTCKRFLARHGFEYVPIDPAASTEEGVGARSQDGA